MTSVPAIMPTLAIGIPRDALRAMLKAHNQTASKLRGYLQYHELTSAERDALEERLAEVDHAADSCRTILADRPRLVYRGELL